MSEEKQRFTHASNSKLPAVSEIPDKDDMKRVVKLLKEAQASRVKISEAEERLSEIRNELIAICEVYELKGFRNGLAGFEYRGYITRKALNKEKLATLVPADVIDQCYTEGVPFVDCRIVTFDLE